MLWTYLRFTEILYGNSRNLKFLRTHLSTSFQYNRSSGIACLKGALVCHEPCECGAINNILCVRLWSQRRLGFMLVGLVLFGVHVSWGSC